MTGCCGMPVGTVGCLGSVLVITGAGTLGTVAELMSGVRSAGSGPSAAGGVVSSLAMGSSAKVDVVKPNITTKIIPHDFLTNIAISLIPFYLIQQISTFFNITFFRLNREMFT